jgi:DNA repair photolyase
MKIYEPAGRAREYSPLALNYFKGCDHGCKYCYVQPMMRRFNPAYNHSSVSCDLNLSELEASIKKLSKEDRNKQVLLSFTGDPYCGFESGQTRQVLEVLLKHRIHTSILTKNPHKALKDIDLFKQFEHFKIGTTLVVADEAKRQEWEPGTIHSSKRIEALERFQSEGIITWASFEPVIYPEHSLLMIEKVSGFIDHVKVGKLNNYKGIDKDINWGKFLFDAVYLMRSKKMDFYIKKDLAVFNNGVYLSGNEINEDYLNI